MLQRQNALVHMTRKYDPCFAALIFVLGLSEAGCGEKSTSDFVESRLSVGTLASAPPCQGHAHRDAAGKCTCDEGYEEDATGVCWLQAHSGKPDLTLSEFHLSIHSQGGFLYVCISTPPDQITVKNLGTKDAGVYSIGVGLIEYDQTQVAGGCKFSSPHGISAGATSTLKALGCCQVPSARLKRTVSYSAISVSDIDDIIAESDEENNLGLTQPFMISDTPKAMPSDLVLSGAYRPSAGIDPHLFALPPARLPLR